MDLRSSFQKLITDNKLSHSYLLFGFPEIDFVKQLANFLENKKWELSKAPLLDFFLLASDEKDSIGIDAVKAAADFLWTKPLKSSHKTLVINQADQLTLPAQNAILKIAEEPPAHSLIFIIIKDPDVLLNPLVSRFQKIYIPPVITPCPSEAFSECGSERAKQFLSASSAEKAILIKEIAADDYALKEFIKSVMLELDKNPISNFISLKELNYRWMLMSRYNTNKKLQLESWARSFSG